jgi:hypothetical protein
VDTLLNVDNLTKTFGARRVLSNVGFSAGSGEVVGLIGPNFVRLVAKEVRELSASRSFWLLLLFVGFLVGQISMRFKLVAGQLDSCAGILFNLKPNRDYLTVRFNGKEDNVVLWTFLKGRPLPCRSTFGGSNFVLRSKSHVNSAPS